MNTSYAMKAYSFGEGVGSQSKLHTDVHLLTNYSTGA